VSELSPQAALAALRRAQRIGPLAVTQLPLGRGWLGARVDEEAPRPLQITTLRIPDAAQRASAARRIAGGHALAWSRRLPVVFLGETGDRLWCAQSWVAGVPLDALLLRARDAGGLLPRALASALYMGFVTAGQPTEPQRREPAPDPEAPRLADYVVTHTGQVLHVDPSREGTRVEVGELLAALQQVAEPFDPSALRRGSIDPRALGRFVATIASDVLEAQEVLFEEVAMLASELPRGGVAPVTSIPGAIPAGRVRALEERLRTGDVDGAMPEIVQAVHAEVGRLAHRVDAEALVLDSAWSDETVSLVTHALRQKARRVVRE
jgi:hypothetical protein